MKRYIALIFAIIFVLGCFTACNREKKIDGTEIVSDRVNDYAVVTNKDGSLQRDEAGNLIVVVTNEDGKEVKDNKGEVVTEIKSIDKAIIIGNTIELKDYYLTLPEGWEDNKSFNGIQIKKTNTNDQITIELIEGKSDIEVQQNCEKLVKAAKDYNADAVVTKKGIEINGINCNYDGVFVPKGTSGNPVYYAYAVCQADNGVYRFYISSDRDLEQDSEEIISILNSIKFKNLSKDTTVATTVTTTVASTTEAK